ncbi:MAG: SRPBCC family protein [Candidatus Binatia bacterium]
MPRVSTSEVINRTCGEVFDLIHDYGRRLEWDTLLRKAQLLHGAEKAAKGVRSLCVGKWVVGGIALETEYVSYERGKVAAVKMTNHPLFFGTFTATLRHESLNDSQSKVTYIYNFRAKPKWMAWLFEPIMNYLLLKEIKSRLKALKNFMEKGRENE